MEKGLGWKGYIPAVGTAKYAYSTIAKVVPIPDVAFGWSAPFRDQEDKPQCGPYSFCEVYYVERIRMGLNPVMLDPQDLADSYAKHTGQPFDGVHNRVMMEVAAKYGVLCKEDGQRYYISAWHELNLSHTAEVVYCLAERRSFLAGFPVYQYAFDEAKNGITTMPVRGDNWLGGHDCSFKGYIMEPKNPIFEGKPILIGQNHWKDWGFGPDNPPGFEGDAFGVDGNFTMPLEFLVKYGADAWTITLK
jgi:hypothetical protein